VGPIMYGLQAQIKNKTYVLKEPRTLLNITSDEADGKLKDSETSRKHLCSSDV
jgi:hypothetical protein